jgi:hypothetical protein
MLRIVQTGNSLPFSYIVDPSAQFEPGQIAQLNASGNQIVCGVSDGRFPIGIIDDIRTRSFSAPAWNEVVIVSVDSPNTVNGVLVSPIEIKQELANPNVVQTSFTSTVSCTLNPRNGVVTFLAGTPLNFDLTGSGMPNAIKAVVNYRYQVPNIIGDDSTAGSGRITVWFQRMIASTTCYETNQTYPLNANLFSSETGLFTTRMPFENAPTIAIVTGPPSPMQGSLEFLWL